MQTPRSIRALSSKAASQLQQRTVAPRWGRLPIASVEQLVFDVAACHQGSDLLRPAPLQVALDLRAEVFLGAQHHHPIVLSVA